MDVQSEEGLIVSVEESVNDKRPRYDGNSENESRKAPSGDSALWSL